MLLIQEFALSTLTKLDCCVDLSCQRKGCQGITEEDLQPNQEKFVKLVYQMSEQLKMFEDCIKKIKIDHDIQETFKNLNKVWREILEILEPKTRKFGEQLRAGRITADEIYEYLTTFNYEPSAVDLRNDISDTRGFVRIKSKNSTPVMNTADKESLAKTWELAIRFKVKLVYLDQNRPNQGKIRIVLLSSFILALPLGSNKQ